MSDAVLGGRTDNTRLLVCCIESSVKSRESRKLTFAPHLATVDVGAKHQCTKMCSRLFRSGQFRNACHSQRATYICHAPSADERVINQFSRCGLFRAKSTFRIASTQTESTNV